MSQRDPTASLSEGTFEPQEESSSSFSASADAVPGKTPKKDKRCVISVGAYFTLLFSTCFTPEKLTQVTI